MALALRAALVSFVFSVRGGSFEDAWRIVDDFGEIEDEAALRSAMESVVAEVGSRF